MFLTAFTLIYFNGEQTEFYTKLYVCKLFMQAIYASYLCKLQEESSLY